MGKTEKDVINWHRFHDKVYELPTPQREKADVMSKHNAGNRSGNKRKFEAALKKKLSKDRKRAQKAT